VCRLHDSVIDTVHCPALRWHNTATRINSHHQLRSFGVDAVDVANMSVRLPRKHKQLKRMPRHHTIVSAGKRERANHAKSNIPVDGISAEGHAIASHTELPMDLCNHLGGRLAVFFWHCPLFGNKIGCTRVGLSVNGLVITLVLIADLLLV